MRSDFVILSLLPFAGVCAAWLGAAVQRSPHRLGESTRLWLGSEARWTLDHVGSDGRWSRSPRRCGLLRDCLLLTTLVLASACWRSPRDYRALTARQLEYLEEHVVPLVALGLRQHEDHLGIVSFPGSYSFASTRATEAMLPLLADPLRRPVVAISVNGVEMSAVVDTGSTRSMIRYEAARDARLIPIQSELSEDDSASALYNEPAKSFTGPIGQYLAIAGTLSIGEFELHAVPMWIPDDQRPPWSSLGRVDVVLGYDFLTAFSHVSFDLRVGTLRVSTFTSYRPDPERHRATVRLLADTPLPMIASRIHRGDPSLLVIDTGGGFGLLVPRRLAGRLGFRIVDDSRVTDGYPFIEYAVGVGGMSALKTVEPSSVTIGSLRLEVPTLIATTHLKELDPPFAFLGVDALDGYVVTFDFVAARMHLEAD